ncbi:MAG: thioredoxin family protein [Nanoarchaeota archaeon]
MALIGSEDKLKKRDMAPDFKLKGTDGNFYNLNDIKGKKATLIVFICNHCPYVIPKLPELNRIAKDFKSKGVVIIGINSNDSENYPEDSFSKMQAFVNEGKVKFYYLLDKTQNIARTYGALCTPDPFLFDEGLKLVFHSRIDDTHKQEEANRHEMYEAIAQLLEKGSIKIKENPSMGCSIKWKESTD